MDTREELAENSSIAAMFLHRVRAGRHRPALWYRESADAPFQSATWEDLLHDVYAIVRSSEEAGLYVAGDRAVQIRDNSREWITFDLAMMMLGVWHVALNTHLALDQMVSAIQHCEPKSIVVATPQLRDRLAAICGEIPITLSSLSNDDASQVSTDEVLQHLEERVAGIDPNSTCTLVYTSGTTGQPKGVMLSHRNLAFDAQATVHAYDEKPVDKRLSFLPFSHLYARTCDVYTWIARGSQLVLAFSRETILGDCQATTPTLINGVPYFYQKVVEGLKLSGKLDERGSLKKAFGGEIRMCASGGAPLAKWVIDAFEKQQVSLLEGYGLTESSPVITVSTEGAHRPGSVGKPLKGVEVRATEAGEIETRGPHVMQGYYQNDEATRQIMDGEWLRTGDLGLIDDEGFLWITGRQKEILLLSTGRNVNPEALEIAIGSDPLVAQVMVCGEGRKCLSALIVPNPDLLRQRIQEARLWVFSKQQALEHPTVRQWFRDILDCQLANRSDYEQVGPFTILGQGFTPASGELTPKLSLRRCEILKNYDAIIQQMYEPAQVSRPWWRSWLP
ncbi:AMP-dependent synthetase/ligase [Bremerella sp. JC817]|uniref:AMP-dependent synthetase/ligase n=1 Tax=Bremerella sp. JC817 TaxID=3231756 RepID=UPI003459C39C